MYQHVLVPVDFSPRGRTVARHAFDLARAAGGRVTLLHVLTDGDPARAEALLHALTVYGRRPPTVLIVPPEPDAARAILLAAARGGTDLIVMGVHAGPDAGLAVGSVAREVLLHASVPVQIVPGAYGPPERDGRWQALIPHR